MIKRFLVIVFMLVGASLPAYSGEWMQISDKTYIDSGSIRQDKTDKNIYSFRIKFLNDNSDYYVNLKKILKTDIWYEIYNAKANCSKKVFSLRKDYIYNLNNELVYTRDLSTSKQYQIGKDSYLNDIVCNNAEYYRANKQTIVSSFTSSSNNSFSSAPMVKSPEDIYSRNVKSMLKVLSLSGNGPILGSGVIIRSDGTFVTCYHVVENQDSILVQTKDGKIYNVDGIKHINIYDDIAILTLDTRGDKFNYIDVSKNVPKIGESVYTISNPEGASFSFTSGMISNLGYDNMQFTAPISHGSSGGALLNDKGQLVGIITSFLIDGQNMNYATRMDRYYNKINGTKYVNSYDRPFYLFVKDYFYAMQYKN